MPAAPATACNTVRSTVEASMAAHWLFRIVGADRGSRLCARGLYDAGSGPIPFSVLTLR